MGDQLFRIITPGAAFRCVVVWMPQTAETLFRQHLPTPQMGEYLVNLTMSALLLASGEKGLGALSLRIHTEGRLGYLAADATPEGLVRGMISAATIHKEENGGHHALPLVGPGTFSVARTALDGGPPYTGVVEIQSPFLGPLLTHYLLSSQQIKSSASLSTHFSDGRIAKACGFLVQALPGLEEQDLEKMEKNILRLGDFQSFTESLARPEELMEEVLSGFQWKILSETPVAFHCPCNEDRILNAIFSTGESEVRAIISEGKALEVFCDFCRKRYLVPVETVEGLLTRFPGGAA